MFEMPIIISVYELLLVPLFLTILIAFWMERGWKRKVMFFAGFVLLVTLVIVFLCYPDWEIVRWI